jgi:D-3-phosphoglycerate dehydrogenase
VQIGDFPITFIPEGKLIYAPHRNVPGVIGQLTTIIGEYNVNISRMVTASGTNDSSHDSIMILGIDNDVPVEALERCKKIAKVDDMKVIDLS